MKFEDCFKKENLELLFDCVSHENEFIACTDGSCSEYNSCDIFSRDWAWQFPAGRYVISVYQRFAVFKDGAEVYRNNNFQKAANGNSRPKKLRYSLITKKENEYYIPSWKRSLITNFVQDEKEPLQRRCFLSEEKAREAAAEYSENGNTAAVLCWYDDFDMY